MGRAEARTEGAGVLRGWARQGERGVLGLLWGVGRRESSCPLVLSGKSLTPAPPPNSCHLQEPRLDVKRMPGCLPVDSVGTMASLMPLSPYLSPTVLLLVSCDLGFVRAGE